MSHVLVWDLETIPDISGFAAANDLFDKTAEEVREVMGDKFQKHIYHEIICIGALIAHQETNGHWIIDALGAPNVGERSEQELIASFVDRIVELTPQLVTFNGSSFDLPVLRYRAMAGRSRRDGSVWLAQEAEGCGDSSRLIVSRTIQACGPARAAWRCSSRCAAPHRG